MTPRTEVLAVLLVALLGGCGDEDSGGGPAGAGQATVEERADNAPGPDTVDTGSGAEEEGPAAQADAAPEEAARGPRGRRQQRPRRRQARARPPRDAPPGRRRPTRAQAIAAADDVCGRFRRGVAALPDEGRSFGALVRRTGALRQLTEGTAKRLRLVRAPAERRSSLRDYIRSIEAQLPVLEDLQAAAEREDRDGISDAYGRIQVLGDAAKRFARRYGLRVCGSG